jgi:hypothetical protein
VASEVEAHDWGMRALIVFESMYGNTRTIGEHIAVGLADRYEVTLVPVANATPELVAQADLLVCGAPTHVHGLSRPSTRRAAVEATKKDTTLEIQPGADGPGLREWLDGLEYLDGASAAVFDTRIKAPALLTGRASRRIARRLRRSGRKLAVAPRSFLVDKHNHLLDDQPGLAEAWGRSLVAELSPVTASR